MFKFKFIKTAHTVCVVRCSARLVMEKVSFGSFARSFYYYFFCSLIDFFVDCDIAQTSICLTSFHSVAHSIWLGIDWILIDCHCSVPIHANVLPIRHTCFSIVIFIFRSYVPVYMSCQLLTTHTPKKKKSTRTKTKTEHRMGSKMEQNQNARKCTHHLACARLQCHELPERTISYENFCMFSLCKQTTSILIHWYRYTDILITLLQFYF